MHYLLNDFIYHVMKNHVSPFVIYCNYSTWSIIEEAKTVDFLHVRNPSLRRWSVARRNKPRPEAFVPVVRSRVVTMPEGREEAGFAYRFKRFNHLLPKFERRAFERVHTFIDGSIFSPETKRYVIKEGTLSVRHELIFVEDLNFLTNACFRLTSKQY